MTAQRYSAAAIFLHWAIALALAFQLALGWSLEDLPKGPPLLAAYQLHKSVGITILLLTLLRLLIRLLRPRPPLMADSRMAAFLARSVHWAFYAVLILGPVTGWVLVSTARIKVPTLLFGQIAWPHLPVPASLHEPFEPLHNLLAYAALGLFFPHVAGALRHQFIKDENILGRMIPFLGAGLVSRARSGVAAVLAQLALWAAHGAAWRWDFGSDQSQAETRAAPKAMESPAPVADVAKTAAVAESASVEEKAAQEATEPMADWRVAPGGRLGFRARWSGSAIDGQFKSWNARIRFTPDALEETDIRVAIDLASADTADSQRDESLKSSDFFDVAAHPRAVFSAKGLKPLGKDRYQARGTLDLHGTSKPVTLNFTMKIAADVARVDGSATLDRTTFGVGSGEWASTDQIAGPVDVTFGFSARRMAPK